MGHLIAINVSFLYTSCKVMVLQSCLLFFGTSRNTCLKLGCHFIAAHKHHPNELVSRLSCLVKQVVVFIWPMSSESNIPKKYEPIPHWLTHYKFICFIRLSLNLGLYVCVFFHHRRGTTTQVNGEHARMYGTPRIRTRNTLLTHIYVGN